MRRVAHRPWLMPSLPPWLSWMVSDAVSGPVLSLNRCRSSAPLAECPLVVLSPVPPGCPLSQSDTAAPQAGCPLSRGHSALSLLERGCPLVAPGCPGCPLSSAPWLSSLQGALGSLSLMPSLPPSPPARSPTAESCVPVTWGTLGAAAVAAAVLVTRGDSEAAPRRATQIQTSDSDPDE